MHHFFISVLVLLAVGTWIATKDLFIPLFLSFVAFGVWVSRDSRQLVAKDNAPLLPEEKHRIRANGLRSISTLPALGIALMCYLLAMTQLADPPIPPFSGRMRHLYTFLFANFGANGIPSFWFILGTVGGLLTWSYKK
ncbi:MAG: hypothetical protein AB1591_00420 [Pseudomonadota bacterium]